MKKQAGTGPSRRHTQGSKIAKGPPSVNSQDSKIEKAKNMNRVARRGPLARAPGAPKRGHFRNFFVAVEGGPFGEKTNFREKSHNAEKLKEGGGPFEILNTQSVVKYQRN